MDTRKYTRPSVITALRVSARAAMADIIKVCDVVVSPIKRTDLAKLAIVIVATGLGRALRPANTTGP